MCYVRFFNSTGRGVSFNLPGVMSTFRVEAAPFRVNTWRVVVLAMIAIVHPHNTHEHCGCWNGLVQADVRKYGHASLSSKSNNKRIRSTPCKD